jgi:hypothetical protein
MAHKKKVFVMGAPLAAVVIASLFPIRPIIQQALIGVVLVWMQFTFLLFYMK